ncbi:MAG: SDR family oxidoreductase [Kangiellaceae bacterium]|nr:SDR family oxidoreductase [Kangiellaceae bacterium]
MAFVTGASLRLGRAISEELHRRGCSLVLHFNRSAEDAEALATRLNSKRKDSCHLIRADLSKQEQVKDLVDKVVKIYARLDYLINNASIFYPTPLLELNQRDILRFNRVNWLAAVNLSNSAFAHLAKTNGAVINMLDIYAEAGHSEHSAYVASKAALAESTQQLAIEFAPHVRVNGVSPGAILWPEITGSDKDSDAQLPSDALKTQIIQNTALKRLGEPNNIAKTVAYLAMDATYSTGSIIKVDGGRRLYI